MAKLAEMGKDAKVTKMGKVADMFNAKWFKWLDLQKRLKQVNWSKLLKWTKCLNF